MAGIEEKKAAFQELERRGKFKDLAPEKVAAVDELRKRLFGEKVTMPQAVVRGAAKTPLVREAAAGIQGVGEKIGQEAGRAFERGKQILGIEPERELPKVPSFAEAISTAREDITGKVQRAEEQRPTSTKAGQIGSLAVTGARAIPAAAKALAPLGVGRILGTIAGSAGFGAATTPEKQEQERAADDLLSVLFDPRTPLEAAASGAAFGVAGEGLAGAVKGGARLAGKAGTRILASLRGISPDSIRTFSKNPKAVDQIIKQKVAEFVPAWGDDVTENLRNWVSQRTQSVKSMLQSVDQPVNITGLKKFAQESLDDISQMRTTGGKVRQLNKLQKQVKLLADLPDNLSASQLQQLKQDLQEEAFDVFVEKGFRKSPAQEFLEKVAKRAQGAVEEVVPDITPINKELSEGIKLQKGLKIKNLFKPDGGIDEGLARRLLVSNKPEDLKRLNQLQKLTGIPVSDSKEAFKAAKDLGSEDLLSSIFTGRSALPVLTGAMLGQAGGAAGASIGGAAGLVAGSPLVTRPLIRAGKAAGGLAGAITPGRVSATGQAFTRGRQ